MSRTGKIAGIFFLIIMVGIIFYLALDVRNEKPYEIKLIELNGCNYLPTENYYTYANLDNTDSYPSLTLPILKSRFEKHPYVKSVDVLYTGNGKVEIDIKEKSFKALLFAKNKKYIITDNFELLPVLKYTQHLVLPIITVSDTNYTMFQNVKEKKGLIPSFEILDALKIINPQLYDNLSEIVLNKDKNIELYFTFSDYPVKVKQGKEIENIYGYNRLWKYLSGNKLNDNIKFIDFRYRGKIFIGMDESYVKGEES